MVLKRKRSESELSLSSSSAFNSPQRPDHFSSMDLDTSPIRRTSRGSTPSHLPSRTMKRFRDSRPSDEEIHRKFYEWRAHHHRCHQSTSLRQPSTERTLNMLYTAQKQHITHQQQQELAQMAGLAIQPQPQPQPQSQPRLQITPAHSHGAFQASLHSFWKLPSAAAPTAVAFPPPVNNSVYDSPANCEDCGQTLREGAGNEDAMDVDDFGTEAETGCGACGKHVCSHCSITNLGEQRRCLICAGKKVWVGGLGWAGVSGVKVC
ncbi:hypothetical protein M434DRAFT_400353 [Hypoxylon sp. CO27-5]|nr:hypothetical protein M434DRAFT_400353 [Hypoxylon sp. CO27-5]